MIFKICIEIIIRGSTGFAFIIFEGYAKTTTFLGLHHFMGKWKSRNETSGHGK